MDAKNIQKLVEKAKNDILQEVNDLCPNLNVFGFFVQICVCTR